MKRRNILIYIFFITLVISYFIVGYVINTMMVHIDWIENVTIWQKFKEYYIRTFLQNIFPALIIAGVVTYGYRLVSKVVKYVRKTRYMK